MNLTYNVQILSFKKILSFIIAFLIISGTLLAQDVPQAFKYQAVIRTPNGELIQNSPIELKISLIPSIGGNFSVPVYQELHEVSTNKFGLANINVGWGEILLGDFSTIEWEETDYFLGVEISVNSGAFINMGATQLLSVPYTFIAQQALTADDFIISNDLFVENNVELNISGGHTINHGDLLVKNTSSTILSGDLNVDGATDLNNTLTVTGGNVSNLTGALNVDGATDLNNNLNVDGTTDLNNTLTVTGGNVSNLTGPLNVDGATDLNNNLNVDGTTDLNNTLTVTGGNVSNLTGPLNVDGATDLNNNLNVDGTTDLNNTLTVTGGNEANLTGALNVDGATDLNNNLNVDGTTDLNNTLTVTGGNEANLTGALNVDGATDLNNNLNVDGTTDLNNTLTVTGGNEANLTGALNVDGATDLNNNLNVDGTTDLNNTLTVTGGNEAEFSGFVTVEAGINIGGTTTMQDAEAINLNIENAFIETAEITNATIETAAIVTAEIANAELETATITDYLVVNTVEAQNIDVEFANIETANIEIAEIANANIETGTAELLIVNTVETETINAVGGFFELVDIETANIEIAEIANANIETGTAELLIVNTVEAQNINAVGGFFEFVDIASAEIANANIETGTAELLIVNTVETETINALGGNFEFANIETANIASAEIESLVISEDISSAEGSFENLTVTTDAIIESATIENLNITGDIEKLSVNGEEGVTITKTSGSSQLIFTDHALRVEGEQGIGVRIPDGTVGGSSNFMTFFDGNDNALGRIEGQTLGDLHSSWEYIYETTFFSLDIALTLAQSVAAGLSFPPDVAEVAVNGIQGAILAAHYATWRVHEEDNVGVYFSSGGADYAEWLEEANQAELFSYGDIVGVIGGKISKNMTNPDHYMVVSKDPIVLGNMPQQGQENRFEKIAFMGQVPVKVRGKVKVGDYIIGSNLKDGFGKAVSPDEITLEQLQRIVGVAWSGYDSKYGNSMVNVAIGINANDAVKKMQQQEEEIVSVKSQLNNVIAYLQAKDPSFDATLFEVNEADNNTAKHSDVVYQAATSLPAINVNEQLDDILIMIENNPDFVLQVQAHLKADLDKKGVKYHLFEQTNRMVTDQQYLIDMLKDMR